MLARRLGTGAEITAIAAGSADHHSVKLATSTRDHLVQVWTYDRGNQLINIWTVELPGAIPIEASFFNTLTNDLYIFGLWDGCM